MLTNNTANNIQFVSQEIVVNDNDDDDGDDNDDDDDDDDDDDEIYDNRDASLLDLQKFFLPTNRQLFQKSTPLE